jgi:hypothetical protein
VRNYRTVRPSQKWFSHETSGHIEKLCQHRVRYIGRFKLRTKKGPICDGRLRNSKWLVLNPAFYLVTANSSGAIQPSDPSNHRSPHWFAPVTTQDGRYVPTACANSASHIRIPSLSVRHRVRGEIDFGFALTLIQNALIWRNWRNGAIVFP